MSNLVSVIIPVYNVKQYLDECLESIVNQSYRNLEILLIDDGSTDGSDLICDGWSKKDNRIKVIHKANGGLSSARNSGLDIATGEYISFIDSDDIVSNDMILELVQGMNANKVIMSICEIKTFTNDDINNSKPFYPRKSGIISNREYLSEILRHKADNASVNKIFHRDTIGNTRFKEGIINEDFPFILDILLQKGNVNILSSGVYYYRLRSGSITQQANPKIFDFIKNGIDASQKIDDDLKYISDGYLCYECVNLISTIEKYNSKADFEREYNYCIEFIRNKAWYNLTNPNWPIGYKLKYLLVSKFPQFYRFLLKLFK